MVISQLHMSQAHIFELLHLSCDHVGIQSHAKRFRVCGQLVCLVLCDLCLERLSDDIQMLRSRRFKGKRGLGRKRARGKETWRRRKQLQTQGRKCLRLDIKVECRMTRSQPRTNCYMLVRRLPDLKRHEGHVRCSFHVIQYLSQCQFQGPHNVRVLRMRSPTRIIR